MARERAGPLPLSSAQRQMWFLHQLDPQSRALVVPLTRRLRGPLDADALRRALEAVVARHDVLRASFPAPGGVPEQVIGEAGRCELAVGDDLERAWQELSRPFDLTAGPLVRAALVRISPDDHALLVAMHHIVSDGWSVGVLWSELRALYDAFVRGEEPSLPPLAIQFADHVAGERDWLRGPAFERHLAYWRDRLAGAPEETALPCDRPRPARQRFRGASVTVEIDAAVSDRLREIGRRYRATLFTTILAGLRVLLYRHGGQTDLCIGTPSAGRERRAVRGLIGCFVNTVALRTRVDPQASFASLLAAEQKTAREAYAHPAPLGMVVEALGIARRADRTPLFQVLLTDWSVVNLGGDRLAGSLDAGPLDVGGEAAAFDLSLFTWTSDGRISIRLVHDLALFDGETAGLLGHHLVRLLEVVSLDPERRIGEIDLSDDSERDLVGRVSRGARRALPASTVLDWIAAQAARRPDAVAIATGRQVLTYRELIDWAHAIGGRLVGLGIAPEEPVGVSVERGPGLVAAMLGVLAAGGAYVPLDPQLPRDRLAFMMEDAGLRLVLDDVEGDRERPPFPRRAASPDQLAYVMYTSGSTGRPKGVQVTHGALVNLLQSMRHRPGIDEEDVLLAVTTASFDISGLELFLPLIAGARVVVASGEEARDGLLLAATIESSDATIVQATPSTWRLLAAGGWQGRTGLKALCGGEPLAPDLAAWLGERVGELWNLYGPTETTIWSSRSRVGAAELVHLGEPIDGTQLHVLEPVSLAPAPLAVAGELFIGGVGLARGYRGRPDLTAERFVPDPGGVPGARMYRTGDRVRRRAGGQLVYLGRSDEQIKVRGVRIEPAEIERVLRADPAVSECAVIARDDVLVAYLVRAAGSELDEDALRRRLRAELPESMIPSALVELSALPVTPNRKLDRKALPSPSMDGATRTAPRSELEEQLARLWAEVLGVDQVGVHDDFFALGGHSLLATRLVAGARRLLDVELAVRDLFEAPTVARLAVQVSRLRHRRIVAPFAAAPRDRPLPLSRAQEMFLAEHRLDPGGHLHHMALAHRLRGRLDVEALRRAFEAVVRRHEVLRTVFVERRGVACQVIQPAGRWELPLVALQPDEEARRPFDLERGPLLRTQLVREGADDHLLLVTLHHIVCDGWSVQILWRELAALYAGFAGGVDEPLPPLALQYADHAAWERRREGADGLAWWRERLAGAPAESTPASGPRRALPRLSRGGRVTVEIDAAVCERLRELGRRERTTLFAILLAGFRATLSAAAGQEELCIGTLTANRRGDNEALIGPFFNSLVLRGRASGGDRFADLVAREREGLLDAHEHEQVPFAALVDALGAADQTRTPLFQVLFAWQDRSWDRPELAGLTASRLGGPLREPFHGLVHSPQLDLAVHVVEQGRAVEVHFTHDDRILRAEVERLAARYARLLALVSIDPQRALAEVVG